MSLQTLPTVLGYMPSTRTHAALRECGDDAAPAGSYEIAAAALSLLTATHADRRMAGPVTMDYLAGVPADRSQTLDLVAGMTALATMLMQMRAEETGMAPEDTLAELGRRVRDALPGSEWT
jgi:hypothetical protein